MSTLAEPKLDAETLVADLARAGRKAQRSLAGMDEAG
jgi:hypothetical protein